MVEYLDFVKDWPINTVAEAQTYAAQNFGKSAEAMLSLYGLDRDGAIKPGLAYAFGDTQFSYGVRGLARGMAAVEPKVWRYVFTHAPGSETVPRRIARRSTTCSETWARTGGCRAHQ